MLPIPVQRSTRWGIARDEASGTRRDGVGRRDLEVGTKLELAERITGRFAPVETANGECEWIFPEGSRQAVTEHGTTKRYGQALRAGVRPCQACRTANTRADLAHRRLRNEAGGKTVKTRKR